MPVLLLPHPDHVLLLAAFPRISNVPTLWRSAWHASSPSAPLQHVNSHDCPARPPGQPPVPADCNSTTRPFAWSAELRYRINFTRITAGGPLGMLHLPVPHCSMSTPTTAPPAPLGNLQFLQIATRQHDHLLGPQSCVIVLTSLVSQLAVRLACFISQCPLAACQLPRLPRPPPWATSGPCSFMTTRRRWSALSGLSETRKQNQNQNQNDGD